MVITLKRVYEYLISINHNRWALKSIISILFGLIFLKFVFPIVLKTVCKTQLRITPATQARSIFNEIPFMLTTKVYLFNVTNPQQVMTGSKPQLQQIGPYFFDTKRTKENRVDNKDDDTLEYDLVNKYYFRPDLSGAGLTGDEIVTVAHPLLLGMFMAMNVDREELLPFMLAATNDMFHHPKDIFYTGPAKNLLFTGIEIDCSSSGFEASAVCGELSGDDYQSVQPLNETTLQFNILGNINDTTVARFLVWRGKKKIKNVGSAIAINGEKELDVWDEGKCNEIRGTDGTIYAPFLRKTDDYWVFAPTLCRSLQVTYQQKAKYKGIQLSRYIVDIGVNSTEEPGCWCRDENFCPLEGTFDLFPCIGAPFIITNPHFYMADPSLMEKVESGLSANESLHFSRLDLYQYAGTLVSYAVRFQINIELVPVEDIPILKDLQPMYFPIFWLEESNDLNKKWTAIVKFELVYLLALIKYLRYFCILGGIVCLAISATAYYLKLEGADMVQPPSKVIKSELSAIKTIGPTFEEKINEVDGKAPVTKKT